MTLHQRAREYAKKQLDKRRAAMDRGERVGGFLNLIARAFFHGYVGGKKDLIEELRQEGVQLNGRRGTEDKGPLGDENEM